MSYNFDELVNRVGTGSVKWDYYPGNTGSNDVIPCWIADMDFPSPPFIVDALSERVKHSVFGYTRFSNQTKTAIKSWYKRRHNWDIKEEWIIQCPFGIVVSMTVALQSLKINKAIAMPPVYGPFIEIPKKNNKKLELVPLKRSVSKFEIDFAKFSELAKKNKNSVLFFCNPHNPTGNVWSSDELQELSNICYNNNIFIFSDEIHSDLVYKPYKHISTASIPKIANQTITFHSVSKTFNVAGLDSSFVIIIDDQIRSSFCNTLFKLGFHDGCLFGDIAHHAAFSQGDQWVDELMEYLSGNLKMITDFTENNKKIKINFPQATFLAWLDFSSIGLDHENINKELLETSKVLLADGLFFGEEGRDFFRLNFACQKSILKEILQRIKKVF